MLAIDLRLHPNLHNSQCDASDVNQWKTIIHYYDHFNSKFLNTIPPIILVWIFHFAILTTRNSSSSRLQNLQRFCLGTSHKLKLKQLTVHEDCISFVLAIHLFFFSKTTPHLPVRVISRLAWLNCHSRILHALIEMNSLASNKTAI